MRASYFSSSQERANERGDFTKVDVEDMYNGGTATYSTQQPPRQSVLNWQTSWWWWWEISGLVIGVAAAIGLIIFLKIVDNTPLRLWSLPIQANTFVASLVTINRAALFMPVASCIGQLKWNHFNTPRRLVDLQRFDGASRGPWGSLIFLLHVSSSSKALLTAGFSLLTILALGLDASAQQLLEFPIQHTEVSDGSVLMGAATGYSSKSINIQLDLQALNPKVIPLQFEILNTLRGSTFDGSFACPPDAAQCKWDSVTTLGVCSSWNTATVATNGCNMTTVYIPSTAINTTYALCDFTLSNNNSGNPELAAAVYPQHMSLSFRIPSVKSISGNKVYDSNFIPGPYMSEIEFGEFFAVKGPKTTNISSQASFEPPEAEVFTASFWWCTKTFHGITAKPSGVKYANVSTERLTFVSTEVIDNGGHGRYFGSNYNYVANSTGQKYTLDEGSFTNLQEYFHTLLIANASDQAVEIADGSLFKTGALLYEQDLKNVTKAMSDTMTNILRSRSLDENSNITEVAGIAIYNEIYISIRWPWMIFPLFETVFVTLLVILTIINTAKQPLLKDSVLAYLATTLTDYDAQKTTQEFRLTRWTNQQELDNVAGGIAVRLESDDHGRLEFSRKSG